MSKMGAPRKEIDFDQLKKLCQIQCTEEEIAGVFDIDIDTLVARIKEKYNCTFSEYFKRNSQLGKCSLRRTMFDKATKGNVSMLIWLSKQHLGMRDKIEGFDDSEQAPPVQVIIEVEDGRIEI